MDRILIMNQVPFDPREEAWYSSLSPAEGRRYTIFPGFCDVHVHFREPGFSYKETMESGSRAAARGGLTIWPLVPLPFLNPA